ncbi:MAG: hypothetical protein R3D27_03240 [Hyphomicrobiaceae bacterium]
MSKKPGKPKKDEVETDLTEEEAGAARDRLIKRVLDLPPKPKRSAPAKKAERKK